MSYKFVKISSFYPQYLNYYSNKTKIKNKSYKEELESLMSDSFGWANFLTKNLEFLNVEAHEIVVNAQFLQEKWQEENNLQFSKNNLLLEQLKKINPNVIMFEDISLLDDKLLNFLKRNSTIPKIIAWSGAPYSKENLRYFKHCDIVLSCSKKFVSNFVSHGINSVYFRHAFEKSLIPKLNENNNFEDYDMIFIGSLVMASGFHNQRIKILENLIEKKLNIKLFGNIHKSKSQKILQKIFSATKKLGLSTFLNYSYYKNVNSTRYIERKTVPPIFGLEMLKAISRAKIGFNSHIDIAEECAGNMRLFEVTGVGTCLITDWKENLHELFNIDEEVVAYKTPEECVEKVKWLLENPIQRQQIARAGQARTLKEHTFRHRAEELNQIIKKLL